MLACGANGEKYNRAKDDEYKFNLLMTFILWTRHGVFACLGSAVKDRRAISPSYTLRYLSRGVGRGKAAIKNREQSQPF